MTSDLSDDGVDGIIAANEDEERDRKATNWVNDKLLGAFENSFDANDEPLSTVKAKNVGENSQADFDVSLAREMNRLSIKERERRFEEIHGVFRNIEETPDLIREKVYALGSFIDSSSIPKPAYNAACEMDRDYVESDKFRLMFLRAELFDVEKAAKRLLMFLEKKMQYFGNDALVRPLTLKDLSESDQRTLEAGSVQVLPYRDRSGRVVFLDGMFNGDRLYEHYSSHFKCFMYLMLATFENDEEAQKNGAVVILWYVDYLRVDNDVDATFTQEASSASRWSPMRIAAMHMCIDNNLVKQLWARFTMAIQPVLRHHFRVHEGTSTEVVYELLTYGIPTNCLPVNDEGKMKSAYSRKLVAMHRARDDILMNKQQPQPQRITSSSSGGNNQHTNSTSRSTWNKIAIPSNRDVLFGKGEPIMKHMGNQHFRGLIADSLDQFAHAHKGKKTEMTWEIVKAIQIPGGRFLRKDSTGWWEEVPDTEARVKVGKAYADFRNKRAKALKLAAAETSPLSLPPLSVLSADYSNAGANQVSKRMKISSMDQSKDGSFVFLLN